MREHRVNRILKKDFMKLCEDDVMFITNPGRMGDEDGSTFVMKQGEKYVIYRIDGWMYPQKSVDERECITLDDALKQFPKWYEAWKHGGEKDYEGKYKYLYMGFGNGLSVDHSIYEEYKPYLDKAVEKNLEKYDEEEKKEMQYAAIFHLWEEAFIEMAKEKNIIVE